MVSREEAYDRLKKDDDLLLISVDDLRENTMQRLIEDLDQVKRQIIEMQSSRARTETPPQKVQEMKEQREITIDKIREFRR